MVLESAFHWKYDAHNDVWTKGKLRVSGTLIAFLSPKPTRGKHIKALRRLALSVSRPLGPGITVTRRGRQRIIQRIQQRGRLHVA